MLTLKQKKDIYGILLQGFEKEVDIPLSSVSLYLKNKRIDYSKFGYKKMKSFLNDLEFLSLKTPEDSAHNDVFVTIHSFSSKEATFSGVSKTKKEQKKLSDKAKEKILSYLLSKYQREKEYLLSLISQDIIDYGISYKEYGFKKNKDLIQSLSKDIEFKENKESKLIYVIFHEPKQVVKEETKIKLPDLNQSIFFLPENQIRFLKDSTALGMDDESFRKRILNDYQLAKNQHKITIKDDCFLFDLTFKNNQGEDLICAIKKAPEKLPYDYFSNFITTDKERPKDALKNAISFEDFDKSIQELAELAKTEKWCYSHSPDSYVILKIYLQYTYYRLEKQQKILFDKKSNFAAFNTGLKTDDYEDIYALLMKNGNKKAEQKYLFQSFAIPGRQGWGKVLVEHFNPLPEPATYIDKQSDYFYDVNRELHIDSQHIIIDNLDRFPISFLNTMMYPFEKEKEILSTIANTKNDYAKEKLYNKLKTCVSKNTLLYTLLRTALDLTVEKAKRMVLYDYRMALPSFFPTRNTISMMLPLEFSTNKGIETVLLVEKTQSGNYQGQTILTAKQSYVNARLIGPLTNTYLNPELIED